MALVAAGNAYVLWSAPKGETTDEVAEVPRADVAIVLGALVKPDGEMSSMLADRVRQASALWHAGKVDKILVSGDHHTWAYDEPDTMRKALVADGVDPRDVFEDHAGSDTWATMVRAHGTFGVRDAVVVTQGFHMPRALYLANAAGIDATGLSADLHEWGYQGRKSEAREMLSRLKAIVDVTLDTPAMAGPRIPISTSDGRESWGPPPPPGVPPAGSPGRASLFQDKSTPKAEATHASKLKAHQWKFQPLSNVRAFKLHVSTGYCVGTPKPYIDRVKIVERARAAIITAFVRYPSSRAKFESCAGVGLGLSRRVVLKRSIKEIALYDGRTVPSTKRWPRSKRQPPSVGA